MTPQKFWMVWTHSTPTTQHRHPSLELAQQEADRIASQPQNINKKVYVLEAMDYRYIALTPLLKYEL